MLVGKKKYPNTVKRIKKGVELSELDLYLTVFLLIYLLVYNMSRKLVRSLRNISSTPAEIKIKAATSNDSFGPTTSELNDIAILTNDMKQLRQITTVLNKRINDNSRNWRHVLKSLTVIQYCMLAGSIEFVYWIENNQYLITTLKEFQLKDSNEIAHQIRTKAKSITKLLKDSKLLEEKRSNYHIYRTKMSQPALGGKRSSLDISRQDVELDVEAIGSPVLEAGWGASKMRGTKSLEIRRPTRGISDWENDKGNTYLGHRYRNSDEISQMLANIDEE